MSATMSSPTYFFASGTWKPAFGRPIVTVAVASTATPSGRPVSASRPEGDIDRDHRHPALVEAVHVQDQLLLEAGRRAREPRAEERVDDAGHRPRLEAAHEVDLALLRRPPGPARRGRRVEGALDGEHFHLEAALRQQARRHEAVSPLLPRPQTATTVQSREMRSSTRSATAFPAASMRVSTGIFRSSMARRSISCISLRVTYRMAIYRSRLSSSSSRRTRRGTTPATARAWCT